MDYRGGDDYREKKHRRSRSRSRSRSPKRRSRSPRPSRRSRSRSRSRDRERKHRGSRSRSRSRDRKDKKSKKSKRSNSELRGDRPEYDEFGRLIDYTRQKSESPVRSRRKEFDPRTLRRSESPDRNVVEQPVVEQPANPQFAVDEGDDPETAAAKMEMQMMAMMGMPVDFNTTKGKGNAQSDKTAVAGAVRIKPQRQTRQYMNRRCGFNKPLPGEATRQVQGVGTSTLDGSNNVKW